MLVKFSCLFMSISRKNPASSSLFEDVWCIGVTRCRSKECSSCCKVRQCSCTPRKPAHSSILDDVSGSLPTELMAHVSEVFFCPLHFCLLCIRNSINSRNKKMAGLLGFEPRLHGIKTRCLTAWLQPNNTILINGGGGQIRTAEP